MKAKISKGKWGASIGVFCRKDVIKMIRENWSRYFRKVLVLSRYCAT
jgi:hypothetical protein